MRENGLIACRRVGPFIVRVHKVPKFLDLFFFLILRKSEGTVIPPPLCMFVCLGGGGAADFYVF